MEKHWIRYSFHWLMPLIKAYKWKLLLIVTLMTVSVGLNLIQVNFIQQSIDAVLVRNTDRLLQVLGLFIGITLLRLAHGYIYELNNNNLYVDMEKDVKNTFVHKVLRAKMKEINRENSGDLNTKCNSDIPNSLNFIRHVFSTFVLHPIMSVGGMIYLFCYNWKLSLFVFIPLPILAVLLNAMSSKASGIFKEIQSLNSDYTEHVYDVIHGAETIKTYNMQSVQMGKIRRTLMSMLQKGNQLGVNYMVTIALILAVTYVPIVIAFIYGAYLVKTGEIEISLLFGYAQLISTICTPVIFLFSSMNAIKNAYHSIKRLDTVMDLEEEKTGGQSLQMDDELAVRFSDVRFGYDPETPLFEHFDLEIRKGQCVGIVGSSGAGKSTIVQLMCGLYERDAGMIEVFHRDIHNLDLDSLRSHISYVSQQTFIIPGTVYDNIRFNNLNATEEEIQRAVEWAGLREYVDTLPEGLHTVLTEGGGNLSGGQRQRISLARAFLRDASIYIFDEPTSSLDPDTEAHIVRRINEVVGREGITAIIISHNHRAIANCDVVYHIREGKITDLQPSTGDGMGALIL